MRSPEAHRRPTRRRLAVAAVALGGAVVAVGATGAVPAVGALGATPAAAAPGRPASPSPAASPSGPSSAGAPAQLPDGSCADGDGVTVVIDFQELGGGVEVRCAPDRPGTGFAALQQAGISYDTTVRFPGFLCRIAGKPSNDPCYTASPADAYWSYWMAPRGGRWCYSNFGAGARRPVPGPVEGWSFSLNKTAEQTPRPRYLPDPLGSGPQPQIPAKDCTVPTEGATTTTSPPTTRPGSGPTRPGGGGGGGGGGDGTPPVPTAPGAPTTRVGATTTRPGATTTTRPGATTTTRPGDTTTTDGAAGAGRGGAAGRGTSGDETAAAGDVEINSGEVDLAGGGSRGSALPVVLTVAGLVIVAAVATVAIRKRQADQRAAPLAVVSAAASPPPPPPSGDGESGPGEPSEGP